MRFPYRNSVCITRFPYTTCKSSPS